MVSVKSVQKNLCQDCREEIRVKDDGEILNGFELIYDIGGEKIKTFKCKNCFEKDKSLKNYQTCEVYSRVVGYLRPVQQWNLGKQKEFKQRKVYKI
jgi:hypothetical protein